MLIKYFMPSLWLQFTRATPINRTDKIPFHATSILSEYAKINLFLLARKPQTTAASKEPLKWACSKVLFQHLGGLIAAHFLHQSRNTCVLWASEIFFHSVLTNGTDITVQRETRENKTKIKVSVTPELFSANEYAFRC